MDDFEMPHNEPQPLYNPFINVKNILFIFMFSYIFATQKKEKKKNYL